MGRLALAKNKRKTSLLNVRMTKRERRAFDREAGKLTMSTSAWARMWLCYGAHLVKFAPRTVKGEDLVKE